MPLTTREVPQRWLVELDSPERGCPRPHRGHLDAGSRPLLLPPIRNAAARRLVPRIQRQPRGAGAVSIEGEPQPRPVHDPFPSMGLSVADPVSHRERIPRICGLVCLDGTPSRTCMTPPHVTYEIHEVAGRR